MTRILLLSLIVGSSLLSAQNKAVERCAKSAEVLEEIMATPDKAIPRDLLSKAHCVAIVPGLIKGAFIVGAKKGTGVILCRGDGGKGWTGPSTVRVEGGSFGLQIGGSSTDVVLLVMNAKGKDKLLSSKFTLGGDAAVAGGPVGRSAAAQTAAQLTAEILLSYSRSKGVFAGLSLEGATMRGDADEDKKIYGKSVDRRQILSGAVAAPASVSGLIATLTKLSSAEHR